MTERPPPQAIVHLLARTQDDALAQARAHLAALQATQAPFDHAVLLHGQPGQGAAACLASRQACGWLHPALPETLWGEHSAARAHQAAQAAVQRGLCATDAAICAMSAAWGTDASSPRACFPLLGDAPEASSFASMPPESLHAAHPYALYAVMGDAQWAIRCMEMGVQLVQLRIKNAPCAQLDADIENCAAAAAAHGALLIVNDRWQAALRYLRKPGARGLYGVHLGQEDLATLDACALAMLRDSGLRLGISSHSLWELARALCVRPSYIACGPVHATTTKIMPWQPLGAQGVALWAQVLHDDAHWPALPLVAIGGMRPDRAEQAAAAGADIVAVVSHITQAPDARQAIGDLQKAIAQGQAARTCSTQGSCA